MPFLVLRGALFVTKSAIFVQDNVAVYTNLRSKVPFLFPKTIANLRMPFYTSLLCGNFDIFEKIPSKSGYLNLVKVEALSNRTIELKRTGTLPETGNLKPNFRLEPSLSTRYQHTA